MTLSASWPLCRTGCSGTQKLFINSFLLGQRHTSIIAHAHCKKVEWKEGCMHGAATSGVVNQNSCCLKTLGRSAARGRSSGPGALMIIHYTKEDELAFFNRQKDMANHTNLANIVCHPT